MATRKKKANCKVKDPISSRFGAFVAKTVPGSAVKLGRLAARAGKGSAVAGRNFKDGFVKGWDEV